MSIRITSNIGEIAARLQNRLRSLTNPQLLTRPVVIALLPEYQARIHEDGKASNGSQIGTYSNPYLNYRKNNGRGGNATVIASFTRQLQNAYNAGPSESGNGWAITLLNDGRNPTANYLNSKNPGKTAKSAQTSNVTNGELVKYLEATYGKPIFSLTQQEKELAVWLIKVQVNKAMNGLFR